jgi:hypothetical protein
MAKEGWEKGAGPYSRSYPELVPYPGITGDKDSTSRGKDKSATVERNSGMDNGFAGKLKGD